MFSQVTSMGMEVNVTVSTTYTAYTFEPRSLAIFSPISTAFCVRFEPSVAIRIFLNSCSAMLYPHR